MDPEFVLDPATLDLHASDELLRRAGSLVPVLVEGVRAWAATSHSTLEAVLSHPAMTRDIRYWDAEARAAAPQGTSLMRLVTDASMLNADGEEHRRLRGPLVKLFSARQVQRMEPWITSIVGDLLEELAALPPDEPIDLRAEYAYPLPLRVIVEMLGIPDSHREPLRALTDQVVQLAQSPPDSSEGRRALFEMVGEIIELRRATPGEDLTSELIALHEQGQLDDAELRDTVQVLLIAGHVTTINLIAHAVRALLDRPGQLELLLSGAVPWSAAVEEALRWESPNAYFPMRYAMEDLEIEGVRLRAGEAVLACFSAAGRDPERYGDNAADFDVTRPSVPHLAFGHGPHFCLGAPLARLQAEVALPALFAAFPELRAAGPADDLPRLTSLLDNGIRGLPVLLGPPASR
ncbi:cytochrome P450 [Nonomuraea sp. WAC 01424]|uniref:cytochrome P450 family protein n=1 Tax=Nonomuraea sp. WAC 01424 TaxID=2203200 RepID=UPI00163CF47E|nr:cytochrome P450 [Nonomuraea sp. WAC 01424]